MRIITQIIFFLVLVSECFAAEQIFYVDTDCATPGNGSDSVCDGNAGDPYASLSAFDTAEATDLVTAGDTVTVKVMGSAADTTAVTFDTDWTTGPSNCITVRTDSALSESAHSGTYPTSSYRIEAADYFGVIRVETNCVNIIGLAIKSTEATNHGRGLHYRNGVNATIKDNIIVGNVGSNSNTNHHGIDLENVSATTTKNYKLVNNLIYDFYNGVNINGNNSDTYVLYNNGVDNVSNYAFSFIAYGTSDTLRWKNNWAETCTGNCYNLVSTWTNETNTTNLSEDGTLSTGTGTCTFTNQGSDDYTLASGDSACKEAGTDLSADGDYAFSDDFIGTTRTASWSIGPHELDAGGGGGGGVEIFRRRLMQ